MPTTTNRRPLASDKQEALLRLEALYPGFRRRSERDYVLVAEQSRSNEHDAERLARVTNEQLEQADLSEELRAVYRPFRGSWKVYVYRSREVGT